MAPYLSAPSTSGTSFESTTLHEPINSKVRLPAHITATKLPFFDTEARAIVDSPKATQDEFCHSLSASNQPVVKGVRQILECYAQFVGALADSEDIAFVARVTGHRLVSPTEAIAHAKLSNHGKLVSSERKVDLNLIEEHYIDDGLDFEIGILTHTVREEKKESSKKPFSVWLLATEASGLFDISLSCSSSNVPEAAAAHLFQLVLYYLRPRESSGGNQNLDLALSILNYPLPSSEPLPLPWDTPSSYAVPSLLHSAFERRAIEFPDRSVIDYLHTNSVGYPQYSCISLTYRDAVARVADISAGLERALRSAEWPSIRGNQRAIPVFMSPCPELYLSILAILKTGHVFCPLPVDAPAERLKDILEDLGSPVVLGMSSKRFTLLGFASGPGDHRQLENTVWLDVSDLDGWFALASKADASAGSTSAYSLTGDSLAYIYYTSGSTGKPKGVQISHLAATCTISAHAAVMPKLTKMKPLRWFQLAAVTFDPFMLEVFFTFSSGGTLCVAERNITLGDVEGAINALEANTTNCVPSLAMIFRSERMPTLKTLLCSGEQLNRKVIETFSFDSPSMSKHATAASCPEGLINLYGPTEATINVTAQRFTTKTRGTIIGEVLPSCFVVLVDDETLQPVPMGLSGQLAIGGPQLSHGYLNRPEENAKQFVPSPEFGRLYLTGDKARIVWDERGKQKIEYLGRIQDGQVKLNGRRVELEEIDSVIARCNLVSEVAAITLEGPGGVQLVACAVVSPGATESQAESGCRKFAEGHLPRWMNPHHYVFFSALTRNTSGKVDRKSLKKMSKLILDSRANSPKPKSIPTPGFSVVNIATEKTSPPTDAELPTVICTLVKQALIDESQDVNLTTSLFSLGFDSLRAIAFLQQAKDLGIYELGIQDMLKGMTPGALAKTIVSRRRIRKKKAERAINSNQEAEISVGGDSSVYHSPRLQKLLSDFDYRCRSRCAGNLGISPTDIEHIYPTTYIQTRMVANFLAADTPRNHMVRKPWIEHFVYDVPTSLDSHRFQEAVSTVLRRHDCFRTVFTLVEDATAPCAQVVLSPLCPQAKIPWSNIYCNTSDNHVNGLFERSIENSQRSADEQMCLERPPVAVSFIRCTSGDRCILVLSLFHGIQDGASLTLLRKEIMAEYHSHPAPSRTSLATAVGLHFGADQTTTLNFWIARLAVTPYYMLAGVPKPQYSSNGHDPHAFIHTNGDKSMNSSYVISDSPVSVVKIDSMIGYPDLVSKARIALLTTPLSVFQAAWALVLLECQQQVDPNRPKDEPNSYDVTFGSTIHSRHDQAAQICMGPVLTTIPVCIAGDTSQEGAESNREMCLILANEHAEALEHLQIPCPSLEFARNLDRFDSTLILQAFGNENSTEDTGDFPGFEKGDKWIPAYRGSDFCIPVLIEIMPSISKTMMFMCTFMNKSPKYPWLNEATAAQLLQMFEANLLWILANPDETFDFRKRSFSASCL